MFRGLIFSGLFDIIAQQTERYPSGRRVRTRNAVASASWARVRIPFSPPNKHRDFDTKSRCSSYLQKSRNTNIFKAFRYNVLPGRDYSCRFFCYIMVEQQMCHKLNVRIIGLSCRLWEVTCNLSSYRAPYGAIV